LGFDNGLFTKARISPKVQTLKNSIALNTIKNNYETVKLISRKIPMTIKLKLRFIIKVIVA